MKLERIVARLIDDIEPLHFGDPVTHVYNPLVYAQAAHRAYLRRYGSGTREVVLLGMNPGPWGMVQTGIPFGEVSFVREWLGIETTVKKPADEHPKREVEGFSCRRSEVSGRRLWGWARDTFGPARNFFARFFVANYCPLAFFEESGRNLTPDKLPASQREPLFAACDTALRRTVESLRPRYVVGIGAFATRRAEIALAGMNVSIGRILHPSPASPMANRGWAAQATRQLIELGIRLPSLGGGG
ncbi:MAG: single-stranded DNA-binding protein [Planctomycetes bacterium]|nr:single-stranded DNA-binding protein [Planctomycetota bacterium]